jgi:hypothetical protein
MEDRHHHRKPRWRVSHLYPAAEGLAGPPVVVLHEVFGVNVESRVWTSASPPSPTGNPRC